MWTRVKTEYAENSAQNVHMLTLKFMDISIKKVALKGLNTFFYEGREYDFFFSLSFHLEFKTKKVTESYIISLKSNSWPPSLKT
jgi:hypothetical protein